MRTWHRFWAQVAASSVLLYPLPAGLSSVDAGESEKVAKETSALRLLREARMRVKAGNLTMLVSKPGVAVACKRASMGKTCLGSGVSWWAMGG